MGDDYNIAIQMLGVDFLPEFFNFGGGFGNALTALEFFSQLVFGEEKMKEPNEGQTVVKTGLEFAEVLVDLDSRPGFLLFRSDDFSRLPAAFERRTVNNIEFDLFFEFAGALQSLLPALFRQVGNMAVGFIGQQPSVMFGLSVANEK